MKGHTTAALCAAAAALIAQPLAAAELPRDNAGSRIERGSFAGARLRLPLGGSEKAHAGLALTMTQRAPGSAELRFARGLELGYAGDEQVQLSLGGRGLSELTQGKAGPQGRKMGVSTVGWVAIGVGLTAVALFAAYVKIANDASE